MIEISRDCIFASDAHFNTNRIQFKTFLKKIKEKKIITSQVVLMGDMFDFLAVQVEYFRKQNQHIIDLINELSFDIEIIYLEGNHDFNIKKLFPKVLVFPRQSQPVYCKYEDKKIALSHGDIFSTPASYEVFVKVIRNSFVLGFIDFIDFKNWLSIRVDDGLKLKNIKSVCDDFEAFSKMRLSYYPSDIDLVIEGHYHYGKISKKYVNISSLAVSNSYYLFEKKLFSNI